MRSTAYLSHAVTSFLKDEAGGSFVEYALLGSLVIVVCTLVLLALTKNGA